MNYSTKDVIAPNAQVKEWKTLLYIFDIDYPENDNKIKDFYNQTIKSQQISETTIYIAKNNETTLGYASISKDLNTLLGIDFISHSETPGLGGRISEN